MRLGGSDVRPDGVLRRRGLAATASRAASAVCVLVVCLGPASASASAAGTTGYASLSHACRAPQPGAATCFAIVRRPVPAARAAVRGVRRYTLGAGAASTGPSGGLTPGDLESAYEYGAGGGEGQTVALVDAYDDPNVEADLAKFDEHYGLGACTKAEGCFRKVSQTGSETSLPPADTTGWSVEVALDVEAVRAVCRGCKILLVEANSNTYSDLAQAVDEAAALGATEISNSYGGPERGLSEGGNAAAYNHPGVVIAAATGDYGWYDWNYLEEGFLPPAMPNAPASLPSVVAVGGTTLRLHAGGSRESETVWNGDGVANENRVPPGDVAGGGCSTVFEAQPWQRHAAGFPASGCATERLAADVAADADPLSGLDVYDSYVYCTAATTECEEVNAGLKAHGGWLTVGGTSLSSPLVAAMYALAGGADAVRYPSLSLYGHLGDASSLYDVTLGGDGFCDGASAAVCGHPNRELSEYFGQTVVVDCEGTTACDARSGLDGPSGVGAPKGLSALQPLLPTAAIELPAKAVAGTPASFGASGSSDPYPGGSIAAYSWSWGDGTPSGTGATPTHAYAAAGVYSVALKVTDSYGVVSGAATREVHVLSVEEAERIKAEEEAKRTSEEEARRRGEEAATRSAAEEAERRRREEEARQRASLVEVAGFKAFSPPPQPLARIARTTLAVHASGKLTLTISCPAGESACTGKVTLRHGHATVASAPFTVPGGASRPVTLRLSTAALRLLAGHRVLRVQATVAAHDGAGARHTTLQSLTLRRG